MKKHKAKRYIFKHFKFPISILYSDPKESLPKAIKLLLKDMEENGLDRWNVEEITEEWGLGKEKSLNTAANNTAEEFEV
jgi:hypothetical protein